MIILAHVDLVVRDLERSLAFYVGVLGCSIADEVILESREADFYFGGRGVSAARVVLLRLPSDGRPFGGMIELLEPLERPAAEPEAAEPARASVYGIRNFTLAVDDLSRTLGELRAKGVHPRREEIEDLTDHGLGKIAFIADPDGNWIELVEASPGRAERVTPSPSVARDVEPGLAAERSQISPELRSQIAARNDTARTYPNELVHEMIERQAAAAPARTALVCEGQSVTYGELNARANQLARRLRERGVGPDGRVGVAIEPSIDMVVSLVAVLKAGAAYVPLDPSYPEKRLVHMIEDARPRIILIEERLRAALPFGAVEVIAVDTARPELARLPPHDLGVAMQPDNLAYIIYTSGSTGRPKGAMNTHSGAVSHLHWLIEEFEFGPEDRLLQRTSICFDVSVGEIFVALTCGATLVLVKLGGQRDLAYMVGLIEDECVTFVDLVPAMLADFLDQDGLERCRRLRLLFLGGEALPGKLAQRARDRIGVEVVNFYGLSEASVDSSFWRCGANEPDVVPLGRPIANTRLHLLDGQLVPVPPGVAGEVYVAGIGLGRGYLDRPRLTAERFVPDPSSPDPGGRMYKTGDLGRVRQDGAIEYIGRSDHQVKIRGFRVEPGEIEAVLARQPMVHEAVVVARQDASGDKRLVAYVVGKDRAPSVEELRRQAARELPEHMVPSVFVVLDQLPTMPNGKLDRNALPVPGAALGGSSEAPRGEAPQGEVEQTLARIWQQLLQVERVGRDDNFMDLGGHSLLAIRMISRIREQFGVELPLDSILTAALTLRELADRIAHGAAHVTTTGPFRRAVQAGDFPVLPAQRRLWLADQMGQRNFDVEAFSLSGPLDVETLRVALDHVVRVHPAFATTFALEAGVLVQRIGSPCDAGLEIVDLSEQTRELAELDLDELGRGESNYPCDVEAGPLHRLVLCRMSAQEHVLFVGMHHLILDGWAMHVFLSDLERAYNAASSGEAPRIAPPPVDCADIARWRAAGGGRPPPELERALIASLDGAPQLLTLRCARPRPPVQQHEGASVPIDLDAVMVEVTRYAREHGVTTVAFLLSAFALLMSREADVGDIVVGVPVANRNRLELERVIGCLMDAVPVRIHVDAFDAVTTLVRSVHASLARAPELGSVALEDILQRVAPARAPDHDPLIQVMFVNETSWEQPLSLAGIRCERRVVHDAAARMDLLCLVYERPSGAGGFLEYRTCLFSQADAARLVDEYVALLKRMCARDVRVDTILRSRLP